MGDTSEEDEPGVLRPRFGQGRLGRGAPLTTIQSGKRRPFQDGAGLCSPGRWAPEDRATCKLAINMKSALLSLLSSRFDLLDLACRMAHGAFKSCPFDDELIKTGRELLLSSVGAKMGCHVDARIFEAASGQPFLLNLLEFVARILGDPDWRVLRRSPNNFSDGVSVGFDDKLPRTPAVYEKKVRWRK